MHPEAEKIAAALAAIDAITDPAEHTQAASDALRTIHKANHRLAESRRASVTELHNRGWSYEKISRLTGTVRSRVGQIISGEPTGVGVPGRKPKKVSAEDETDS